MRTKGKLVAVLAAVMLIAAACGTSGQAVQERVEIPAGAAQAAGWNVAEAEALWASCVAADRELALEALAQHSSAGAWGTSWVSTLGGERLRSGSCAVALLQLLGAAEIGSVVAGIGPGAGLPGEVYGYSVRWRQPEGCTISAAGRQCDAGGAR